MADEIYLIMNKPCGYVCSAVSDSHKTVYELLPPELQALVQGAKRGHRLHTIGRLDCDTSGLLLFTTDGQFSHKIAAEEGIGGLGLTKTYRVLLKNPLSPEEKNEYIVKAAAGLTLPPEKKAPEQKAAPAIIYFPDQTTTDCTITIKEGKFHEVRRIFRALGNEVVSLERQAIGSLCLPPNLKPGQWQKTTKEELNTMIFA